MDKYSGTDRKFAFSYLLNTVDNATITGGGTVNVGFGSAGANSHVNPPWRYFKLTQAQNPALKYMVAEGPTLNAAGDAPNGGSNDGTPVQEDAHWEPVDGSKNFQANNTLTVRHNNKADINFGDGHAAAVFYWTATNVNYVVPGPLP